MVDMTTITTSIIGVGITLAALSFLYKENIFYRYVEYIYVGYASAHAIIFGIVFFRDSAVIPMLKGNHVLLIPIALSLLLFLRFHKGTVFASRWPLAMVVGGALGLHMAAVVPANLVGQVRGTLLPLTTFDNIVLVIGVFAGVSTFLFTERTLKTGGRSVGYLTRLTEKH